MMKVMDQLHCPCGTGRHFDACCGPLLAGEKTATSPEVLMRSRYSAYCRGDISYIADTMTGAPRSTFKEKEMKEWLQRCKWTGLEIIDTKDLSKKKGEVEFKAFFDIQEEPQMLHEISTFEKIDNAWFYTAGQILG